MQREAAFYQVLFWLLLFKIILLNKSLTYVTPRLFHAEESF